MATLKAQSQMIDSSNAPEGYYPAPKDSVRKGNVNICTECDWRKDCAARVCSCMSYERNDGVSVVFKKVVV